MPKRTLLFDIDGTLITSGGAGARALEQAFVELAQIPDALAQVVLDGATDISIVREALGHAGRPATDEFVDQILVRYTELLPSALTSSEGYLLLAGVPALLQRLAATDRAIGLCTGNVRAGARAKLHHGGVWTHFEGGFEGGFGNDGAVRADIVRAALRRAQAHHGRALVPAELLVIGDTPRDIQAAHAVGLPVLAVATGRSTSAELRAAGAEDVVESLATAEALKILEVDT